MTAAITRTKFVIIALLLAVGGLLVISQITPLYAQDEAQTACSGIEAAGGSCSASEDDLGGVIHAVINILLYVVGAAAVVALIVGGIKYVVSAGDQQAITSAKNTVLYAIVGLIVAILAYAAVQYVFGKLNGTA